MVIVCLTCTENKNTWAFLPGKMCQPEKKGRKTGILIRIGVRSQGRESLWVAGLLIGYRFKSR
jgi:hypothetical protein